MVELGRGGAHHLQRGFQRGAAGIGEQRRPVDLQQPGCRIGGVERREPFRKRAIQRRHQRGVARLGQHRGDGVEEIEQEILAQASPEQRGQADDQVAREPLFDKGFERAAVAAIGQFLLERSSALVIAPGEIGQHRDRGDQDEAFRLHLVELRDQRFDRGPIALGRAVGFDHRSGCGGADERAEACAGDLGDIGAVVAGIEPRLAQQRAPDEAGMADQAERQRKGIGGIHRVRSRGRFRVRT